MSGLSENIIGELRQDVQRGELTPEVLIRVRQVIDSNVEAWTQAKVETLEEMVADWERVMEDDDKTLYSLGLRRAVDVIREETAYSQLPILEKPETPTE